MNPRIERAGYVSLAGYALTAPFSILVSQAFLIIGLACMLTAGPAIVPCLRRAGMSWFLAGAGGYAATTLISALFSGDPRSSLADCKSLLLLLLPPAAVLFLDSARRQRRFFVFLGASSLVAALWGIYQYYWLFDAGGIATRAHGFFSIYTTYGQFMMLIGAFALGVAVSPYDRRSRSIALAVSALAFYSMILSFVRGAWIGTAAALCLVLFMKKPRYLWAVPVITLLVVLLAPPSVYSRMASIFSLEDESNRDRIDMITSGFAMIRDNPMLGVGPNMVSRAYLIYKVPGSFPRINPHLHNNVIQIAAERGLPSLLFWLIMIGAFLRVAWTGVGTKTAGDQFAALCRAALAALVSFFVAGMFDFNFGDSEIAMPALIMMAVPFMSSRTVVESEK